MLGLALTVLPGNAVADYLYGYYTGNVTIPDPGNGYSNVYLSGAPANSEVYSVTYKALVQHDWPSDLYMYVKSPFGSSYNETSAKHSGNS